MANTAVISMAWAHRSLSTVAIFMRITVRIIQRQQLRQQQQRDLLLYSEKANQ